MSICFPIVSFIHFDGFSGSKEQGWVFIGQFYFFVTCVVEFIFPGMAVRMVRELAFSKPDLIVLGIRSRVELRFIEVES